MKRNKIFLALLCAMVLVLTFGMQVFAVTEGEAPDISEPTECGEFELLDEDKPDPDGEEPKPPHEHVWGDWIVTAEATYMADGSRYRECTDAECDEKETAVIPKRTAYNKWIKVGSQKYYFNSKGVMVKGWKKIKSSNSKSAATKWCYFNNKGIFLKSVKRNTKNKWVKVDSTKYYFTKKSKPVKAGVPYYNYRYKTYVLVDISDQKAYLYKSGKLIRTAECVTGTKGQHDTPTGTFKLMGRYRNCRLTGPTWDRMVSYWMPFTDRGHGLHDSQWRADGEYDGNTEYLTNGSHGCVNLRLADIKLIYSTLRTGSRIIIRK